MQARVSAALFLSLILDLIRLRPRSSRPTPPTVVRATYRSSTWPREALLRPSPLAGVQRASLSRRTGVRYVVDAGADQVWVIDARKWKVAKTIKLGDYAGEHNLQSIAMSPDGAFAYVPRADAKTLAVIDTKTRRVVAAIPLGDVPEGLVIDSTGAFAYVGIGAEWVAVVDLCVAEGCGAG